MAEGGTSPVGDPGNLSIYNLHGGTNKMVELASDVSGGMDLLPCPPDGSHGLFSGQNQTALYPVQSDMVTGSYIQVDPLSYAENGSYEEMKRPTAMPSYFSRADTIQSHQDNLFNSHSLGNYHSSQQEILKTSSESMGYIQLLGNTDSLGHDMEIKKEKLDYDLAMMTSQSADIPYPPNTCISDWNFYNSSMNLPASSENVNQSVAQYNVFNVPSMQHEQQQFMTSSVFENSSHMPPVPLGLSNEDIHNQAKKISHEIMNSGWSSDSLYKSQLYSNVSDDTVNRKRRSEVEKSVRPIKSRRRKSENIDGHSKTIASILMTDNHLPSASKSGQRSRLWLDNEVLDSTERNVLLTSLMDNLRSTVQFESFCLSFPRSQGKEDAFRRKVIHAVHMTNDIPCLALKSNPIPQEYLSRAAKIISSFKSAVLNTEAGSGNQTGDKFQNLRSDQVEEHLPHSMVWTVKVGDHLLTANWEGQFVATVNPVQGTFSFSLFQFQPMFSEDGINCLQQSKLTKTLAADILENMKQFEVSRQLRFDMRLQSVSQIYLFMSGVDRESGCLVMEVQESPVYYQRWIHCSAEIKNKWKLRKSFFKNTNSRSAKYIYVGGLMTELSELVALLVASNHDLEKLYGIGTIHPLKFDFGNLCSYENGYDALEDGYHVSAECEGFNGFDRSVNRLGENCKVLRKEIVNVLGKHDLIKDIDSVNFAEEISGSNIDDFRDDGIKYCENLQIDLDKNVSECFKDYIDYTCNSAIELSKLLTLKVNPSSSGFCDTDFDLSLVPGQDIEQLTVGQLLSTRCSDIVYFSFCSKQVGQLGHEKHCSKCHTCNTWRFWHCDVCNKCTDSKTICAFCGHVRDDPSCIIIKPLSLFKAQEESGNLVHSIEKEEWKASLFLPNDDIIFWDFPRVPPLDNINCVMQYDSTNAMVDQLGLLNPVGFLLGQPASGSCRKHRRYKESRSPWKQGEGQLKNTKSGAVSACNLQ